MSLIKNNINMKYASLITLFVVCVIFSGYSQTENPDTKDLSKEERKALRKAKKEEEKRKRDEALILYEKYAEQRQWVVETYTVFDKQGQSYQMDPTINFVGVTNEETTVQLSFNGLVGWNGVGGITLDGKIGNYEYSNDGKSLNIKMSATGSSIGIVDIFLIVTGDGNGRATVSGNWGERITFQGKFVSLAESRVYKGSTTY
jgi:hypothetical protein